MSTRATNEHTYCEQQARLLTAWHLAISEFSTVVERLVREVGTLPKPEYERLRPEVEAKRVAADNARVNLDFDCLEHGC